MKKILVAIMAMVISMSIFARELSDYQHLDFRWGQSLDEYIEEYGEPKYGITKVNETTLGIIDPYPVRSFSWAIRYAFLFNDKKGLYRVKFSIQDERLLDDWISYFTEKYKMKPGNNVRGDMIWESKYEVALLQTNFLHNYFFPITIFSKHYIPEDLKELIKDVD